MDRHTFLRAFGKPACLRSLLVPFSPIFPFNLHHVPSPNLNCDFNTSLASQEITVAPGMPLLSTTLTPSATTAMAGLGMTESHALGMHFAHDVL